MRLEKLLIPSLLIVVGCTQPDATVGSGFALVLDQQPEPIDKLDVLFMIDNSGSMFAQQAALVAAAHEALFTELELAAGTLPDLHVAFISSDMGAGELITGCNASQEGRFQLGAPTGPGCPDIHGTFLIDEDDGAGGRTRNYDGALSDAFACAATLGVDGCGFEQPLESIRRALDGGNPENDGFLRDDAMLLVVMLTDEDDCSTSDPELFDTSQNSTSEPLGPLSSFRCFEFGVICDDDEPGPREEGVRTSCAPREDSPYMFPVAPYVDFLHGLKSDPSMVMVAGMYGDATTVEVSRDPDRPTNPALTDVCGEDGTPATGADAAVRLAAFAEGFPARWVFTSICEPEMSKRLTKIAQTTGNVMAARGCLLGDLPEQPVCRAFAARTGGDRRALPMCATAGDPACVSLERDAVTCSYTPDSLIARPAAGLLDDGEHLLVECGLAR